jgi:hypothetical protein
MEFNALMLTALNSCLTQATPCNSPQISQNNSPLLSRKVKQAKGNIKYPNGETKIIYSSMFSLEDIKILLGDNSITYYTDENDTMYFSNSKSIIFECDKILFKIM